MKESSKERLATLLMEELLEQLPLRESLRKMFGEMTSQPIDEVIERLLTDFELTVAEYRLSQFNAKKQEAEKKSTKPLEKELNEEVSVLSDKTNGSFPPVVQPSVSPASPPQQEHVFLKPEPEPDKQESVAVKPATLRPVMTEPVQTEMRKSETEKQSPVQRPSLKQNESDTQPANSIQLNPIKLEFPTIQLKLPDISFLKQEAVHAPPEPTLQPEVKKEASPSPMTKAHEEQLHRLEEMAKKLEAEYAARKAQQQSPTPPPVSRMEDFDLVSANPVVKVIDESIKEVLVEEDDEEINSAESDGSSKHTARARYHFADNEYAYVHGVSRIPEGESPVSEPFMLEEKGIDGHEFAFAFDYNGLRYYLSKFNPNEMNVSKAMVLLLNKQESLQRQGVHENVLNDLRAHGILLPFDFGTVVRGRDSLLSMIDKNADDIEEGLDDVEKTTWWTVTASVLDATIAKIVGTDVQTVGRDRSRERASYTSAAQGKKFDIKVLERILQREKKIAEAVHASLSSVAKRADVDTMIGLGSGSSEDWKVILKASYDVPKRDIAKFNRVITDLQYHHLQYDLMLTLAGKKDSLTLRRK